MTRIELVPFHPLWDDLRDFCWSGRMPLKGQGCADGAGYGEGKSCGFGDAAGFGWGYGDGYGTGNGSGRGYGRGWGEENRRPKAIIEQWQDD